MNAAFAENEILIDDGGVYLWAYKDDDSELMRGLAVLETKSCPAPDCDCSEVDLRAMLIDDRIDSVGTTKNNISIKLKNGLTISSAAEYPVFEARVDTKTGDILSVRLAAEDSDLEVCTAVLTRALQDCLQEVLQRRWNVAKKWNRDAWRTKDWSHLNDGEMVFSREVFPDDFCLLLREENSIYIAEDMYCVAPGCDCKTVGLTVCKSSTRWNQNGWEPSWSIFHAGRLLKSTRTREPNSN